MSSYVIAGYLATFGALGLYAYRLVVRSRLTAASVMRDAKRSALTAGESEPPR